MLDALREVALFRRLTDGERQELAASVQPRRYDRNQIIFSRGGRGDGLYMIAAGRVGISREGPDGSEIILTMERQGEYFGELSLFDDEPRSATATALVRSHLLFLARPTFQSFLAAHPEAVMACLHAVVRMLRRCTDLVDELALLDVRSRLTRRLLFLADQADGDRVEITQHHLAGMVGATRESINKHLNGLADDGVIRLDRGGVHVLDRARLAAYADDSW